MERGEATDQAREAIRGAGAAVGLIQQALADGRLSVEDGTILLDSEEEIEEIKVGVVGMSEAVSELRQIVASRDTGAALQLVRTLAGELEQRGVDVPLYEGEASEKAQS